MVLADVAQLAHALKGDGEVQKMGPHLHIIFEPLRVAFVGDRLRVLANFPDPAQLAAQICTVIIQPGSRSS